MNSRPRTARAPIWRSPMQRRNRASRRPLRLGTKMQQNKPSSPNCPQTMRCRIRKGRTSNSGAHPHTSCIGVLMRSKLYISLVLVAAMVGCASNNQKTQKEAAQRQWSSARASVLYSLAKDQYGTGNFDKARQTVDEALKMDPTNEPLHVLAAKLAIEQGQLESAEIDLKQAQTLNAKDAEADYLLGVVYQRWQKLDTALDCYTKASDKSPAELAYIMARAEMLVAMDRQKDALSLLQEKVVYFEHSPVIRDAVGQLLMQMHRTDEAVAMFRQASVLATDDQSIREHLALAQYANKQYSDA